MSNNWPSNQPDAPHDLSKVYNANQEMDQFLGFEFNSDFEQFSQRNDMFTRAFWDEDVRSKHTDAFFKSYRVDAEPRRGEGFSQKDFALRNAAWSISDIISSRSEERGLREGFQAPIQSDTKISPYKFEIEDHGVFSQELKKIAKMFGADLVGITEIDERWHYKDRVDTRTFDEADLELPEGLTHVIVMGHAMDHELVKTYPSALAGASTGMEYSHEAAIVIQLATYIRNLGYEAIASMNDTALVIPYAVKAGLGEYGRNQMVITPEFGPRVRFSKIFTSLPLVPDTPKKLGIKEYCDICTKCADACPPKAIPFGEPTYGTGQKSTIAGVKKWSADCEKCFGYWAKLRSDCAICMRVCPFNRTYDNFADRLFQKLATSKWRKYALKYESFFGKFARLKPGDWWRNLISQ